MSSSPGLVTVILLMLGVSLGNRVEQSPSTLSVQEGNTAVITCTYTDGVSSKQDVSQSPEALSVREGDSVDLNCSYPDSALYFLQWFRQDPGKGLTSLLSIQANQNEQTRGRITVSLDKPSGHSASHIATSQHSDSTTDL
ncbi:hypothetical protein G4228_019729 [Cervus hanglu yarkandensis]|uniref:Immunoglobulin V-set domain-containing protein n=1 Tax=Cervus hanglu yarkandensis TaxID=84702 RepID=A0A833S4C7_9CERV|nr:hypothetical protein G4228_019729 [Cervus hanglu yarkandensis]